MTIYKTHLSRALSATLLSTTAIVASHQAMAADATVLEGIVVEGQSLPAIITVDVDRPDMSPMVDGGTFLKSIPGVDAMSMGGHGLDPVIRGQQQEQLNIISDGAFLYGGCPSRMDPPASLTAIETYDSITVEKGFQSVRHGPGGTGGVVIMERSAPALDEGKPYQIKAGVAGNSNGHGVNANLSVSAASGAAYARATGTKSRSGDYEDGAGTKVRSSYRQWSTGMEVGYAPGDGTEVSVSAERNRTDNVLFAGTGMVAGTGMDSPYGITDVLRLKFAKELESSTVSAVRFNAYDSRVDHLMDNYSLRDVVGMHLRTPTTSNTTGFKIEADAMAGNQPVLVGLDYKGIDRNAVRYSGMNPAAVNTEQSYVWPGIESREIGVFGETTMDLDADRSVKFGLRYDNVRVTASTADVVATVGGGNFRSANQLYAMYYGYGFTTAHENNVSGLMRYEHKLDQDTTTYATVSRSVRTANATERAIAADMAMGSMHVVGNPNIDPEKHYQLDVGVDTKVAGWDVSTSVYYNRVQDFIFRDAARGQSGILLNNGAAVYRNIDATLMGLDLTTQHTFANKVSMNGSLSYTYGQNEETNRAMPQITPLKLGMDVSYPMDEWLIGTRVNASMKQSRVDDDNTTGSGRDAGKTKGHVTADLYASRSIADSIELGLGVTNVFDATYANHLNKTNNFDSTGTQVNEAGRSFYLRMTGTF